jgi:hypothetical protein
MSYQESFDAALQSCPSGELLSYGACVLASLANLEFLLSRHVPGNHDAHVVTEQSCRTGRMVARALTNDCPPPVANEASQVVTTPGASGLVVGTPRAVLSPRKSNLGLNGRLVKRGVTVSFHGIRYLVTKVNRGYLYGKPMTIFGVHYPGAVSERLPCESVQVVQ